MLREEKKKKIVSLALAMTKQKYILFAMLALFFISAFFVSVVKAKASIPNCIVINEIYPAPPSGEKEWVELYNPTLSDVNLADYSLKDGGVAAKNLSGTISASEYFVFEVSSGWLNNSGETLSLIYKPAITTVDQVTYGDWNDNQDNQPSAPSSGKSLSRIPNGSDSDNDKSDLRLVGVTKGLENLLPIYTNLIIINEIVPQPADGSSNEFIELFNSSGIDVDLSSWQLDDIAGGGSSPFTIPAGTVISAGGYLSFYNAVDHLSFNDSGDTARLVDPNGDEKSGVNYSSTKRGQSYSNFSANWQWTTTLTPSVANILTIEIIAADQDAPVLQTDIAGARNQPDGETVQVTGTVSVVPGKLSSQYFYIQDGNSGIQIYNYSKDFPALSVGDEIRVIGEMGSISNERRIKISQASDIIILSTHSPPQPLKTIIDQIGENFEGQYILVTGVVTKTSGSTFYIHGSGEIQVSIRDGTGIKKPKMRVGDRVEIAGILSQYGDFYRILPIVQSDVRIIQSSTLVKTGPNGVILIIIISAILSWITLQIVFPRLKNWRLSFSKKIPE